jgi:hypothetical protein
VHDLKFFKDAVICDLITVGWEDLVFISSTPVVLQARSRRLLLTLNFRTVILPTATAVVLRGSVW